MSWDIGVADIVCSSSVLVLPVLEGGGPNIRYCTDGTKKRNKSVLIVRAISKMGGCISILFVKYFSIPGERSASILVLEVQ
jgi:hypothetical protein